MNRGLYNFIIFASSSMSPKTCVLGSMARRQGKKYLNFEKCVKIQYYQSINSENSSSVAENRYENQENLVSVDLMKYIVEKSNWGNNFGPDEHYHTDEKLSHTRYIFAILWIVIASSIAGYRTRDSNLGANYLPDLMFFMGDRQTVVF